MSAVPERRAPAARRRHTRRELRASGDPSTTEPAAAASPAVSRAPTRGTHRALTWAPGGPRRTLRARPSFAILGRIDTETRSPDGMMVVMDDLEAVARLATAQLRALVTPPRHCRHCGVELEDRPSPGRPLVWCEAHRTAIGRRPSGRVCPGCGVSLDGRRRQTIACSERCRSRLRRRRIRPATRSSPPTNRATASARDRVPAP